MNETPETPAFVREESDGSYSVVDRASGEAIRNFTGDDAGATREAALNHLLSLPAFSPAVPRDGGRQHVPLRDAQRNEVGVWRWLDAAAEEDKPKPDGSRVTAAGIRTMAALMLDPSADPKVIDGGTVAGLGPSPVHASLKDSGTLARGWAYVGADWVDASGRTHLALFAQVFPVVDRAIDSGELGFGSIGFGFNPDDDADQVLIQHSLTNRPATQGLVPGSAMRTDSPVSSTHRFARGPLMRMNMPTPKIVTVRGPAADKLAQLLASANITEPDPDKAICQLYDVMYALKNGATLEKILEGGGAPALARADGETDEAYGARVAALKPAAPAAARAVGGVEGPALEDWASQVLAILQTLSAKVDASAADALTWLQTNQDAIAGAVAASMAAKPDGGDQAPVTPPAADKPKLPPGDPAYARAEVIGLEAKLETARAAQAVSDKRIQDLEQKVARRELQDSIAKRFGDAKITLVDARRDELVDLVVGKPEAEQKKILDMALRAESAPPQGVVPAGGNGAGGQSGGAPGGGPRTAFRSQDEALDHHLNAVRKEKPGITATDAYAEAYRRARADLVNLETDVDEDAGA